MSVHVCVRLVDHPYHQDTSHPIILSMSALINHVSFEVRQGRQHHQMARHHGERVNPKACPAERQEWGLYCLSVWRFFTITLTESTLSEIMSFINTVLKLQKYFITFIHCSTFTTFSEWLCVKPYITLLELAFFFCPWLSCHCPVVLRRHYVSHFHSGQAVKWQKCQCCPVTIQTAFIASTQNRKSQKNHLNWQPINGKRKVIINKKIQRK